MGRAVIEPFPQMRALLLPPNAEWDLDESDLATFLSLTLRDAQSDWNPDYLSSLPEYALRNALNDSGYRSLASCSAAVFEQGVAAYFYVREAAAVTARKAGATVGTQHRAAGGPQLSATMVQALDYADKMASWVVGGLEGPSTPTAQQQLPLRRALARRFETAYLVSYLQHAYATPRGVLAAAELRSWPGLASWDLLLLNRHPDGARALYQPDFYRHFVQMSPGEIIGSEGGRWHAIRSFIWDARDALATERYSRVSLSINHDSPLLWKICLILASTVADPDHDDLEEHAVRIAEDMTWILDTVPLSTASEGTGRPPRPDPLPYGVSPRGAEFLVSEWMKHLGVSDATVTQQSSDGGIDVTSADYVAQVKHYTGSVGGPDIQRLAGAAYPLRKEPLFFTSGRYTPAAERAAEVGGVALFVYNAEAGTLNPANAKALDLVRQAAKQT